VSKSYRNSRSAVFFRFSFFAFDKGFEMLNDYKENKRKEDEEEEKNNVSIFRS